MPYITQEDRVALEPELNNLLALIGVSDCTPGDLNYIITNVILSYLVRKGKSYTTMNEIIGVLECAKQEFYRRGLTLYEESKIRENGDCY